MISQCLVPARPILHPALGIGAGIIAFVVRRIHLHGHAQLFEIGHADAGNRPVAHGGNRFAADLAAGLEILLILLGDAGLNNRAQADGGQGDDRPQVNQGETGWIHSGILFRL